MNTAIWIGLGAVALIMLLRGVLTSSMDRAMRDAIQRDDPAPIIDIIEKKPADSRATLLNHTVKRLWERYQRALATRLIRQLGPRVADASITHYWIQKVLEVEPSLAEEHLDDDFLIQHYQPDLAAQCGAGG